MPVQEMNLKLAAAVGDKEFPFAEFSVNIPVNIGQETKITRRNCGVGISTIVSLQPPDVEDLAERFTSAIKAFKTAFEADPDEVGAVKS